ncbi:putative zinc finger, CCHC-type, LTR copia-type gag-polypeptide, partial [Tanacetum coccineum]
IRQRHVDNDKDPEVSTTSELFALACGPTLTPISVNSCIVNGVSLNDLDFATLHIDGQSTDVDAPPDIIDVDKDDDITNDKDALPRDLEDSDDEDLVNVVVDDDDVAMSADIARGHGGDGGVMIAPLHTRQGKQKTQFGWQESGQAAYLSGDPEPRVKEDHGCTWPRPDPGVADALPFLAPGPGGAEGGGLGKDWDPIYNGNKSALKAQHWVQNPETETNDVESIRRGRPGSRSLASLRDMQEEMLRLQSLGSNTETGMPYTEDEIMAIVQKSKQWGHLYGVGRVLSGQGMDVSMIMKLFRSDDKMSQMITQLESQPEFGSGSGSDGCGDDESGDDEDGGEDEEDADRLDNFITGGNAPSKTIGKKEATKSNPKYIIWYRQDQILFTAILESCSDEIQPVIASALTAKEAWDRLTSSFASKSRSRIIYLKLKLPKNPKGNCSVADFLNEMRSITDELALVQSLIHEEDLLVHILTKLGDEYNSITATLKWMMDSGASHHLTSCPSTLSFVSEYGEPDKIKLSDGTNLPISHTGSTHIYTSSKSLDLPDILCVPKLRKNFISVAKLCRTNHVSVEFFPSHFFVNDLKTGARLIIGENIHDVYYLNSLSHLPQVNATSSTSPIE